MARKGSGIIAIWHDISDEGLADFYEWHDREHMPERLGIEGFQRGRRYIAVAGEPKFFTLYNVRDLSVLSGPAYHARLNAPTPWTQRAVTYFSAEARSLCEVRAVKGNASGGIIGTVRFDCDERADAGLMAMLEGIMGDIVGRPEICAIHVCVADLETSRRRSAEQQEREDNAVPRWVVLIEGSNLGPVRDVLAGPLGDRALRSAGVQNPASSAYVLQHDLLGKLEQG